LIAAWCQQQRRSKTTASSDNTAGGDKSYHDKPIHNTQHTSTLITMDVILAVILHTLDWTLRRM
jgi:hypothetical protein